MTLRAPGTPRPMSAVSGAVDRPLLVTMGDPCGIGPEIIVKARARGELEDAVVIGDPAVMQRAVRAAGLSLAVRPLEPDAGLRDADPAVLPVWLPSGLPAGLSGLPIGQVAEAAGAAAARCIESAVAACLGGRGRAIVTAPIHKEALAAAGVGFPGHTEMLQALCAPEGPGALPEVRMMLANDELCTVLVTVHVSLRRAIDLVSRERVLETLRVAHRAARGWGEPMPRIAVAGLNPHAGEGGLFGDEEQRHIRPAIEAARSEGIDASGPYAPDTVFMRARRRGVPGPDGRSRPLEFDIVVAMTHDHGLIPVKYLGVEQGVNVTLGLPLVRTSPDHGTAFDIAGRGLADPASLVAAVRMARRLSASGPIPAG